MALRRRVTTAIVVLLASGAFAWYVCLRCNFVLVSFEADETCASPHRTSANHEQAMTAALFALGFTAPRYVSVFTRFAATQYGKEEPMFEAVAVAVCCRTCVG